MILCQLLISDMRVLDYKNVKKYIKVYDNVLPQEHCNTLIEKFESNKDQHISTDLNDHRHFTEININQHKDWSNQVQGVYSALRPYVDRYKQDCNVKEKQWPDKYGFEEIRFKRYLPNDKDEFKEHVDVGDYNSARRFLVFFLYLNSNFDGRTSFSEYDMQVYPKAGRLLMFPPTWTYLHAGYKPKLESKYIIGSYLHYV
mgnify:FL=1